VWVFKSPYRGPIAAAPVYASVFGTKKNESTCRQVGAHITSTDRPLWFNKTPAWWRDLDGRRRYRSTKDDVRPRFHELARARDSSQCPLARRNARQPDDSRNSWRLIWIPREYRSLHRRTHSPGMWALQDRLLRAMRAVLRPRSFRFHRCRRTCELTRITWKLRSVRSLLRYAPAKLHNPPFVPKGYFIILFNICTSISTNYFEIYISHPYFKSDITRNFLIIMNKLVKYYPINQK